jgi:enamine deaminase RidA (YjgF/YER057c/UK114 family)
VNTSIRKEPRLKEQRNPSSIHVPLAGYAHQIEVRGDARLLVMSGQVGMTPAGEIPDDAGEQLEVALENVLRNLEAAGMRAADLVKLTFYSTETIDADRRRAILHARLRGHTPCMTLVHVAGLASPKLKVEVDAWASGA